MTLCCIIWLASCNSDDDGTTGTDPVAVQFGTENIAVPKTTAGGDQWVANDRIGIFMIGNGDTDITGNIKENADNIQYKADNGTATSSFSPVSGTPIYYPVSGDKVDFIAYYPYKTPITNYTYPVDVSNQTTPADIDVLYVKATNTGNGYDKNSGTVDLQFSHALSKLSFTLTSGTGAPDLTGAKLEISNLNTTADMSLSNGSLSNINSVKSITANTTANGLSSSAIVIPQTINNSKLTITLAGNNKYEWNFLTTTEFKKGKNHDYTITVDRTGITVSTGNITDWGGKDDPATPGVGGIYYKVGDYYPDPNVVYSSPGVVTSGTAATGVVFWVDPADSRHGKVVGLQEGSHLAWAGSNVVGIVDGSTIMVSGITTEAIDNDSGLVNMQTITKLIENYYLPLLWSYFPAFEWVHNMNDTGEDYSDTSAKGVWYLPAQEELEALSNAKAMVNPGLTSVGGTALSNNIYWSSSEGSIDSYSLFAYTVNFNDGNSSLEDKVTYTYRVRCVLAF
jgi:hypothetical protein